MSTSHTDADNEALARTIAAAKQFEPWFTREADDVLGRIKTNTTEDVKLYHDAVSVLAGARVILQLIASQETPNPPSTGEREVIARIIFHPHTNDLARASWLDAAERYPDSATAFVHHREMESVNRLVSSPVWHNRHRDPIAEVRPYAEAVDIEHGAWETDDIEERAYDLLAVVRYRRSLEAAETTPTDHTVGDR